MMEEAGIIELLKKNIPDGLFCIATPRARKVSAEIAPGVLRKAVQTLFENGARFIIIAALDSGLHVELIYHFDLGGRVTVLKVKVKKEDLEIDTIADLIPAAEWAEKEAAEMCGVKFKNHPKPGHLVLSEKLGITPLQKPFKTPLPEKVASVAESVVTVGATAPITPLVERKRTEAGLPPKPPASYSVESQLKEVHEMIRQTGFSEKVGYDWERKKLRGATK